MSTGERVSDQPVRRDDFIRTHTVVSAPPSVPEIRLHLADEVTRIWEMTEQEMERVGLDPPFWAFAWAGGQALARFLLDDPAHVAGRTVLDLASGSGLCAIAAVKAGATSVLAADIDPFCATAVALNAELNGVRVDVVIEDLLAAPPPPFDVILAGDVSYEHGMSGRMHRWLRDAADDGATIVLIGDPGRRYLPGDGLTRLADYDIVTTPDLEERDLARAAVYTYVPDAATPRS